MSQRPSATPSWQGSLHLASGLRVLAVVAALATAAGCSSEPGRGATSTSARSSGDDVRIEYAVGSRSLEHVDASRPTAAVPELDRPEEPARSLPVHVLYPAEGRPEADPAPVEDAPSPRGRSRSSCSPAAGR